MRLRFADRSSAFSQYRQKLTLRTTTPCRGFLVVTDSFYFFPLSLIDISDGLVSFLPALIRYLDLGQVPFLSSSRGMAPITDQQVGDLKDLVHKLEARVYSLERRLEGGKKPSVTDSMRMILIGPPGAGELAILLIRRVY